MKGVLLNQYGESLSNLEISSKVHLPKPEKSQILIKVCATSINPLDNVMRKGYAKSIVGLTNQELPIILGRECSGEIVEVGQDVWDYNIGDLVWGSNAPFSNGSHAQYVLLDESEISLKPKNLSHRESASVPFAALTALNAITNTAKLEHGSSKRVLVNGGNGGVGFFIVNYLKKHLHIPFVATTCNPIHFDKLKAAGADQVIDYNLSSILQDSTQQPFDIIFNCVTGEQIEDKCIHALKNNTGHLIGFNGSFVSHSDSQGVVQGLPRGVMDTLSKRDQIKTKFNKDIQFDHCLFVPSGPHLAQLAKLYENHTLSVNIDNTLHFGIDEIALAYQAFENRTANGKVVIDV
ncbi:hypothetical protein CYY_000737 [Polysphondylium violaceum]|uniref:Enoyl reductase (ER) domain-containing protein n=1 Tax=Polysphondylium violaceum TaxID=133409 RepID=A0A8J4QAB8_9MYCE|nr:hypothetical protein CYY_000737 [Polysphondylium violaceum]